MPNKTWEQIEQEVEKSMLERFNSVPQSERAALGLEPGTHTKAHENRQWVQTYIQMLEWKNKCRELHQKAYPVQLVKKQSRGNKKRK